MLTIKELKERAGRKQNASKPTLYLRVQNHLALYVLWALLKTPITPNQLTFFMVFFGVVVTGLFALPEYYPALGAALLMVQYLLDSVDGRLARYKNMTSLGGRYLDLMGHALVNPLLFVFMAIGYMTTPHLVILGFFAVLGQSLVEASYFAKKAVIGEGVINGTYTPTPLDSTPGLLQKVYRHTVAPLFRTGEMFLVLLILALFQRLDLALIFYGITLPLLGLLRIRTFFSGLKKITHEEKGY